jgi:hypothetical protein
VNGSALGDKIFWEKQVILSYALTHEQVPKELIMQRHKNVLHCQRQRLNVAQINHLFLSPTTLKTLARNILYVFIDK